MSIPFPYSLESRKFGETLQELSYKQSKDNMNQYVNSENTHTFRHGIGWVTIREDNAETTELQELGVELRLDYGKIRINDVGQLGDFITKFVDGFTSQMVSQMFSHINEVCEEAGQVTKASEHSSNAEAFLEALKKIEFSVDAHGNVPMPQIHASPEMAEKILSDLSLQDAEFIQKIEKIKAEKIEKALAKEKIRRSRYKGVIS